MSDGINEHVKKFFFSSSKNSTTSSEVEGIEVLIPEQLQAAYSFYTWPCAPILAWFLWDHRTELPGKHILELGAGTALPGILAAKCGAHVTLTDSALSPKSLQHISHCCEVNQLDPSQVRVVGLSWGLFLADIYKLGSIDLIISSDCFYEPAIFEDLIATVAFLLERNPVAKFLFTLQVRSSDVSIERYLVKWRLRCEQLPLTGIGAASGVDLSQFMLNHTIHLYQISRV